MTLLRSKSMEDVRLELEEYIDKPDDILKDLKKKLKELKPLAQKVKAMVEMPGWKEFIQPFLDNQSHPGKTFKIFRKTTNDIERAALIGKAEAFFNFNQLINNLLAILDIEDEKEKEEEETKKDLL